MSINYKLATVVHSIVFDVSVVIIYLELFYVGLKRRQDESKYFTRQGFEDDSKQATC